MNKRKTYWRRKQGKIIAEGKMNNKTIFLFTLPEPEIVAKSSLFNKEKQAKILQKIHRLDYRKDNNKIKPSKIRTRKIIGTSKKDGELRE